MNIDEHAQVDFVMLVEHAEAINGKFYIMGGGWNQLTVPAYGQPINLAVALNVSVPWNKSNTKLPLKVSMIDSDGQELMPACIITIVAGRTPNMIYGQSIPQPIALTMLTVIPKKGTYSIVAEITDADVGYETRATFYVHTQGEELP